MFVIKNLDTGLEMRIDDFDKLANIATEEVQVTVASACSASTQQLEQQRLEQQRTHLLDLPDV
jgi:hypothetical protein